MAYPAMAVRAYDRAHNRKRMHDLRSAIGDSNQERTVYDLSEYENLK